jgi:hypothetical protein
VPEDRAFVGCEFCDGAASRYAADLPLTELVLTCDRNWRTLPKLAIVCDEYVKAAG